MPHALLSGNGATTDEVAALLGRWRLTCERLGDRFPDADCFSPLRCNLVIAVCADGVDPAPCLAAAISDAGRVPLLIIGGDHGTGRCRTTAIQQIDSLGQDGRWLRAALDACLDGGCAVEGEDDRLPQLRDYFHFLNHELRTPLTAAKTALEILVDELVEEEAGSPRSDVADIALRNLRRLGETVTETEIYLAERTSPSTPCWRELSAGDLVTEAFAEAESPADSGLFRDVVDAQKQSVGDPASLATILRQIGLVLRRYAPGTGFTPRARVDGDEIHINWRAEGDGEFGRVSRTGMISQRCEDDGDELARLIRFSVAEELLAGLGGRIVCTEVGGLRLRLALPLRHHAPSETVDIGR